MISCQFYGVGCDWVKVHNEYAMNVRLFLDTFYRSSTN